MRRVAWSEPCPIDAPSGCSTGQFSSYLIMQEIIKSWPAFGNSSHLPPHNNVFGWMCSQKRHVFPILASLVERGDFGDIGLSVSLFLCLCMHAVNLPTIMLVPGLAEGWTYTWHAWPVASVPTLWACLVPKFFGKHYCSNFVVIWQVLSDHGLTRFKRFVSWISSKLYN
jgi:hypothetical protein